MIFIVILCFNSVIVAVAYQGQVNVTKVKLQICRSDLYKLVVLLSLNLGNNCVVSQWSMG